MANSIVNRQVNVYINSGEAQKAYDILINREKLLNAELTKTSDPKRIKVLKGELDKLSEPLDRATKKLKGDLAPSIRDLEMATKKFLTEFKKTGDPATLANFQKFKAELDSAKAKLNGLESAQKGLTQKGIFSAAFWANLAAGGAMAIAAQFTGFVVSVFEEALNADEATRRLQGTLENLGRGDYFDRITHKAQDLSDQFRYLDNDNIVGVFNKLIDYGKLTEQEMESLLPVIINFAAKSQISIDDSADIIIKALEGNAKALKEYGIDVSGAKTETERLNIVMTTLKEKVDGAAEAFQNSAKGAIAVSRQEFANLKEDIGNGLLPVLNFGLGLINKWLIGMREIIRIARHPIDTLFPDLGKTPEDIQQQINDRLAQKLVDSLGGKSTLEIGEKINELNQKLADQLRIQARSKVKGSIYNNPEDIARASTGISLLRTELAALYKMQSDAGQNLGIIQEPFPTPEKIDKSKKSIESFADAWKGAMKDLIQFSKDNKLIDETAKPDGGFRGELWKTWLPPDQPFDPSIMQAVEKMVLDNANRLDKLNFTILTTRGKKRMQAQKQLLDEQERQELAARGHTEDEVNLIRQKYTLQRAEVDKQYYENLFSQVKEFAARAFAIISQFDQAKTDRENAELARDQALNDKKKANLDRRLRSGKISQLEYDRELQKIEKQQQDREKAIHIKQFQRQKRLSIAQALIDGAMTISQIFRTIPKVIPGTIFPNPEFPIALGAAIAEKIATVAFIASQKPPEFARGGMLGGRSHTAGGNAIIDGSGRKIAEIEAGEGITNKHTMADRGRYTVSGTPSQIVSRLNGMHGGVQWDGGAMLVPSWQNISPTRMNFSAMARRYATGGLFAQQNGSSGGGGTDNAILISMQATLAQLNQILANGIPAFTLLTDSEKQSSRIAAIRGDAVMRP